MDNSKKYPQDRKNKRVLSSSVNLPLKACSISVFCFLVLLRIILQTIISEKMKFKQLKYNHAFWYEKPWDVGFVDD